MGDAIGTATLALVAVLYARGSSRIASPAARRPSSRRHVAAFACALSAALIAVSEPLDGAAHTSLPMHMVQHVVLLGVVPPLLAVSAPLAVVAAGLPARARRIVDVWLRRTLRSQSAHWGAWMAASFALATSALAVWHLPAPYDAAVRQDSVHAVEHASFIATATLFWWMAVRAGRPARRGVAVIVVFVSSLPATALGVLMVLASTSWYAAYGTHASAVRDQQLAGALMWGFGSLALVASGAALFASWLAAMDRVDATRALHGVTEQW